MFVSESSTIASTAQSNDAPRELQSKVFVVLAPLWFATLIAFSLSAWIASALFALPAFVATRYCSTKKNSSTPIERMLMAIPMVMTVLSFAMFGLVHSLTPMFAVVAAGFARWRLR